MNEKRIISFYVKVNMDGYHAESEHVIENISKDTLIEDVGFSLRTRMVLARGGVKTFGDLYSMTIDDVMKLRNLGRSLEEIRQKLEEYGYALNEVGSEPEKEHSDYKNPGIDELKIEQITSALKALNGDDVTEDEVEDSEIYEDEEPENDFYDTVIYENEDSSLSVEFCGFKVDDSDKTIQFEIWVYNHTDEDRHFWLKRVILDGKTIVNITSIGNVDSNDSDFLSVWMDIDEFTGKKNISFCIEIDDCNDEEIDNSQVVSCIIDFDACDFRFNGLENYVEPYVNYYEDYDDEEIDDIEILDDDIYLDE